MRLTVNLQNQETFYFVLNNSPKVCGYWLNDKSCPKQNAVRSKRVHTSQQNQNTAEKTEEQNETQPDSVVSQT